MIKDDFHTVCSWTQFPAKNAWKYDLLLGTRSFKDLCFWICAERVYKFQTNLLKLDGQVTFGNAYPDEPK